MRHRLFIPAATALLIALTACTQDELADDNRLPEGEYPVVIRATGLSVEATPQAAPSTRATVDGDWQGVQTVALKMGDAVKEYTVTATDADGYRSATLSNAAAPFYWTSRDPITVSAWWPLDDTDITQMPDVQVAADQSKLADFQNSDFISAIDQTVTYDKPTLAFTHRTARVAVSLKAGTGIADVAGATVSLANLSTLYGNPATIDTYPAGDSHEALVLPQTVAAGKPFIRVELGGVTFSFLPQSDITLEAGSRYRYIVSVNATGLTLEGSTIGDWKPGNGQGESGEAVEDLGYTTTTDDQGNVTGYNVYNADGLLAWAEAAQGNLSLDCTLTADITLPEVTADQSNWTPIGDYDHRYTGTFDGGNYTITGLTVTTSGEYAGLFGRIGSGGTVKDVTLEGVQITTTHDRGDAGGVAGLCANGSTLENCFVSGTVSCGYRAGGVAGYLYGSSLTRCGSSAAVEGTYYAGGVVGSNGSSSTLQACYATGDVSGELCGGVAGCNDPGTLIACYHATGTVSGQVIGGVAGKNSGVLTACCWSDSPDTGIGDDDTGTDETAQVTDGDWTEAVIRMNEALDGTDWEYIPGDDGLPVPQKKQ